MDRDRWDVRIATVHDAAVVARLLDDFNTEFETPSPGADVLAGRLASLLDTATTYAILAGRPPIAVALVTLRPNVWYEGSVALLDELYVVPGYRNQGIGSAVIERLINSTQSMGIAAIEINVDEGDIDAQRFYERHGFSSSEPTTNERAFYFFREFEG